MANNDGRGIVPRPADFKYTDTIADKDSVQALLVKQDELIDSLNSIVDVGSRAAVASFDDFSRSAPNGKDIGDLDSAAVYSDAGLIGQVNVGETTIATTAYVSAATSLVVADATLLGARSQTVRLVIVGDTTTAVGVVTLPASGNTITVGATLFLLAAAIGSRIITIPSSVSSNSVVVGKVELKN